MTTETGKKDTKLSDLNVSITKISQNINKLYDERKSLNLMSLAMNNDLDNIKGLPEEQQKILIEVQERQKEANIYFWLWKTEIYRQQNTQLRLHKYACRKK